MRDLSTTIAVLALILVSWYALNRWVLSVYPNDPSAGGEYTVIRWASDPNPARTEQMALFNRLYEDKKVRVVLDPSADVQKILTQAAAGSGPDVFDIYSYATFALYASKGVMVELNDYMREAKLSLDDFWLHRRNALAVPVASALAEADEYERFRMYAVPNNVSTSVTFLNRSLYDAIKRERQAQNLAMPPLPWNHWTWWDYVLLCQALTKKSADGRRYETFGSGGAGFGGGTEQLHLPSRRQPPQRRRHRNHPRFPSQRCSRPVSVRPRQHLPRRALSRRPIRANRWRRLGGAIYTKGCIRRANWAPSSSAAGG